jgi:L-rhamnose mutarotase
MPRVAFQLRLRPGTVEEYEKAHQQVWPELLAKLKEVGISHYSIFRRGLDLFLAMNLTDFDLAWEMLDNDPTNLRWQKEMGRFFEPITDLEPGERFAMMKEVFYME